MLDVCTIESPEAAAAAVDPLRNRLLAELDQPVSAAGLAGRLGIPRQKVNYHLRELERLGLATVAEERHWGGLTERLMVANASTFVISPAALGRIATDPGRIDDQLSAGYLIALGARIVREVSDLVRRAGIAKKKLATLSIDTTVRFRSPTERAEFTRELTAAVTQLVGKYHDTHAPGGRSHRLLVAASTADHLSEGLIIMPVNEDISGRRSVEVNVEVPGTPEQVWQAIATAAGISSWFVPTTSENDSADVPVTMAFNFGPGMESVATVTDWNPPHSFSAESPDLGPDAPVVATQWIVEARDGGVCVVRVVHSLFASTDEWDAPLEAWESGWPDFFRLLRIYLTHFGGQPCSTLQFTGFAPAPRDAAWRTLFKGLGLEAVTTGERAQAAGAAPDMSGTVERVGEEEHPEDLILLLDAPAQGIAHLFAMDMGEQVLVSIRFYLYGTTAAGVAARAEPAWQAWLDTTFPQRHVPSDTCV